ncbi:MAG: phosphotransferase [Acidimicrobiaceae bacterium]|nr:phosphotransferase [Acidimicrobiaceae bacterium]MYG98037.1 phosphotransferase [Acidimicrobiaceae bacterium]
MDGQAATDAELDVELTAELVRDTARGLGLTTAEFRLLRVGNHIVLASLDDRVVARVAYIFLRPLETHAALLSHVVQMAAAGAPMVAPLCDPCRLSDGRIVTFWPMHSPVDELPLETLVTLISQCHRTEPSGSLVAWDPSVSFLTRWTDRLPLMTARGVPADVRGFLGDELHRRVEALSEYWASLSGEERRRVLIHGDAFPTNAVRRDDGTLALVDLDYLGVGPPEVDLSAVLLQYERHDLEPDVRERIHDTYDGSVNDRLLARVYAADEVIELVWLACLWGVVPDADTELLRRVEHWDDPSVPWLLF